MPNWANAAPWGDRCAAPAVFRRKTLLRRTLLAQQHEERHRLEEAIRRRQQQQQKQQRAEVAANQAGQHEGAHARFFGPANKAAPLTAPETAQTDEVMLAARAPKPASSSAGT